MFVVPDLLQEPSPSTGLTEGAYRRLKRSVIELVRPPGEQFTEQAVAREFGLSKTPVREALVRLQRDGLVTPLPRSGYRVTAVTLRDAADLCDMRTLLQSRAALLCARFGLDAPTLERLDELCADDADGQLGGPNFEARFRSNYEFESIMANGGRNERLARAGVDTLDAIERIVRLGVRLSPDMPPARIAERRAIVKAIQDRDPDGAGEAMTTRLTSARGEILSALATSSAVTGASIVAP